MNDWERLGINHTMDASVIKKAYAKQLKLNHPEDDPQGYQEIREAYDRLLKCVKNYERYQNAEILKNDDKEESNSENCINFDQGNPEPESQNQKMRPNSNIKFHHMGTSGQNVAYSEYTEGVVSEFFVKIHQLYGNFFQRLEFKNWEELLNSDIIWNLDAMEIVKIRMIEFLSINYLLPRNVWKYLNRYFEWGDQEDYIRNTYNTAFADYLFLQIGNERVLRYCCFDRTLNINYDEYVFYRESAFMALLIYDFKDAKMNLDKAAALYPGDLDLYCLRGEFYMRTKDYQRAENEFKAALAINSNDIYIYFYKANIYYNAGFYMKALKICNMINNSDQYNYELLVLAGKCYLKMGKLKKAERIFLGNIRINPTDSEIKECLAQIINRYLLYIKKHRFALGTQMRVNKIVKELRNPIQMKDGQNHHIDSRQLVATIFNFVKFVLFILVILFGLILIVKSFNSAQAIGAIAAVLILLVRFIIQWLRKDTSEDFE